MNETKPQWRRFSIRGAHGAEAFRSVATRAEGEHILELDAGEKDFGATLSFSRLERIDVYRGFYERHFRLHVPNAPCFQQGFVTRGHSRCVNNGAAATAGPEGGHVLEPGDVDYESDANFEHSAIFMNSDALAAVLSTLVGAPQSGRLRLDRSEKRARPEAPGLRRLVNLLFQTIDDEAATASPLVIAELEQAILTAFLCGNSHNYSRLLEGPPLRAAPWQLRRVQDYIAANWARPLAIEALAVVADASARSVFYSFNKHYGYSPMQYVKQLRLRHAREVLRQHQCCRQSLKGRQT
jgi:AraC-binding-like domain